MANKKTTGRLLDHPSRINPSDKRLPVTKKAAV
jgi:hypothetical protein